MNKALWCGLLMCSICLEGLGRRYLPSVPSIAFYFLKDAVLLMGLLFFRPPPTVRRATKFLYGGFPIALVVAIGWTAVELFNPQQASWQLGLLGFRAYWLWWLAPPIVAGVLQNERDKRQSIYVLCGICLLVSALAALQFGSPADSNLNLYSVVDGQEVYAADMATVHATGRARVASTFSFLSGFVDFCLLVPALLLSLGLEARTRRSRQITFAAAMAAAAVIPMSGSRGSVLLGAAVLLVMVWASGLFFTRAGRRVLIGGVLASVLAVVAFPDALLGVESRFENTEETFGRVAELSAAVVPPVALGIYEYPALGVGTGMLQNARSSFNVDPGYFAESEAGRYLVELGPIGYLLVWTAKFGLIVALIRAYRILKNAGRRGPAGAALAYALVTMFGNLTFDHVWQALYFLGCGFILAEVTSVLRAGAAAAITQPTMVGPRVSARTTVLTAGRDRYGQAFR